MYRALINGTSIPTERLRWVKQQPNGVFIHCGEEEGQGIILDNEIYHVHGRSKIDKPTVDIVWSDDVLALTEDNAAVMDALVEVYETALTQQDESTAIMLALTEIFELMIGG